MKFVITILLLLACGSLTAAQPFEWSVPPQHSPTQRRVHNIHRPGYYTQQWPAAEPNNYEAQKPASAQEPRRTQEPMQVQEKQTFHQPLAWRFPEPPVAEPPMFPPEFEVKSPVPADGVAIQCGENSIRVEVKRDLIGIDKPILSSDIKLGDCPSTNRDASHTAQVFIFESALHGCGSQLMMYEDDFVYLFTLHYAPTPIIVGSSPIVRATDVEIHLECRYLRKHDVSGEALKPTWMPYAVTEVAEENLHFSLKLMTGNGQFERPSKQYFLGDMMKFEASVVLFHHVPLRVFVDSCVATLIPNSNTVPRYAFLGNHGCLIDGKLTHSSSHFMPRTRDDKLQFEIEAFRFQQDNSGVIYITCHLKATPASVPISAENKACSFSHGWREASGSDQACNCCDNNCQPTDPGMYNAAFMWMSGYHWDHEMSVGPIDVKDRSLD